MSVILKPLEPEQISGIEQTKDRLYRGEYICSTESPNIRKNVFKLKTYNLPIERMHCDCSKIDRVHYCYYLEWALLER